MSGNISTTQKGPCPSHFCERQRPHFALNFQKIFVQVFLTNCIFLYIQSSGFFFTFRLSPSAHPAAPVLLFLHQIPDVMRLNLFQFRDLLPFQKVHQKPCRSPVVALGALGQMAAFTIIQKFVAEIFQTHKKHPFSHGKTTKERVQKS